MFSMISVCGFFLYLVGGSYRALLNTCSRGQLPGPLPSIFGLHVATYIVCDLAGKPIANPLPVKGRKKLYERMYRELLHREEKLAGKTIKCAHAAHTC